MGAVSTGTSIALPWLDGLSAAIQGATDAYGSSSSVGEGLAGFFSAGSLELSLGLLSMPF